MTWERWFLIRANLVMSSTLCVKSGRLRVLKEDEEGQSETVGYLYAGDHFGEGALLTGKGHRTTVRAAEDSEVLRINLRQAEVAHIKAQYERQKALFDRGLISQADMERARMAYLNALAQLPGRMSEIYQQEMAVQDIKRQILEAELSQDREVSQAKYAYDAARLRLEQAQQKVTRAEVTFPFNVRRLTLE